MSALLSSVYFNIFRKYLNNVSLWYNFMDRMNNQVRQKIPTQLLFIYVFFFFDITPRISERIGGGSFVYWTIDFLPSEIVVDSKQDTLIRYLHSDLVHWSLFPTEHFRSLQIFSEHRSLVYTFGSTVLKLYNYLTAPVHFINLPILPSNEKFTH